MTSPISLDELKARQIQLDTERFRMAQRHAAEWENLQIALFTSFLCPVGCFIIGAVIVQFLLPSSVSRWFNHTVVFASGMVLIGIISFATYRYLTRHARAVMRGEYP